MQDVATSGGARRAGCVAGAVLAVGAARRYELAGERRNHRDASAPAAAR